MPGLKRQRAQAESESDEPSDAQSDSSKRRRTSNDLDSGSGDESLDESLDEETQTYATQIAEQQQDKRPQKNVAAENGIIESIECVNFMCHKFLHVDIGPLINFVIGHNGSGKSAVLTALTISLGGKASATNRGGSLKSFIKEGEESCTLIVKIKNSGETGYQHELYGDTIQVERTFNRAGASGFKLKNAAGRIVSTKKGDLEEISDYYALQLDNPISVLTQDQARQFLSNSSAAEKYKFFVRGVQLEQLYQDYEILAEQIAQTEATFEDKQAHISALKNRMQRAKEKVDIIGRQQEFRDKIEPLRVKMAWSQVSDRERQESEAAEILRSHQEQIAAAHRRAAEASAALDEADSAVDRAQNALDQARSEKEPISAEKNEAKARQEQVKTEGTDLQRQERTVKEAIKSKNKTIEKARADIVEEQRRLEEIHGGSHTRRLAQLEERRAAAQRAKDRISEHGRKGQQLQEDCKTAQENLARHKAARAPKQQQVQESEDRLKSIQSKGSRRGAYPQGMEQLVKAIQQDSGFTQKPVGPIADYVHLKKPIWSSILERFFGGTLNGFAVTRKEDQHRLSNLMRKFNCRFPVVIVPEAPINFSRLEPDAQFDTVYRVLDIDHPWILNHMVINHNIEQHILIENMDEAREVMYRQRLTNVKACLSIQTHDPSAGERFQYGADNGVATSYMEPYRGTPRMKAQMQDQINHESSLLQRHRLELREHDDSQRQLQQEVEKCNQAVVRHQRELKGLKIDSQRAEDEAEELQDALDKDAVEEGRLEALKSGLQTAEVEKGRLETTFKECIMAREDYLTKRKEHTKELDRIDRRLEEAAARVVKAQDKLRRVQAARHDLVVNKNAVMDEVQRLEAERDDPETGLKAELERKKLRVQTFIAEATRYGPRVSLAEGETTDFLKIMLEKLFEDIKRQEELIGGNRNQILAEFQLSSTAHRTAMKQFKADEELIQLLKQSYKDRRLRWEKFKKYITARARITFAHFLSERSFHGTLKIDHKNKLLDVHVQPDETQKDKHGRAAKTLSGGEKSFSQICLLLSLWEAIGAPIRCLDEFDVFMDNVNRDLSMKLLIKAARDSVGRQFILITPQSMSSINATDDIKIHKMRDPERNQGTLPFH